MSQMERLYSLAEAAALIHSSVKPAALREAINAKKLNAKRIGRATLIAHSDLMAYLGRCDTCPESDKGHGSNSSGPTPAMEPASKPASKNTDGTSSGAKAAGRGSARPALTTAQRLKSAKKHSPGSLPSSSAGEGSKVLAFPGKSA